jgi:hypothetical protein
MFQATTLSPAEAAQRLINGQEIMVKDYEEYDEKDAMPKSYWPLRIHEVPEKCQTDREELIEWLIQYECLEQWLLSSGPAVPPTPVNHPQTVKVRFILRGRVLYARFFVDGIACDHPLSLKIGVKPPKFKHFPNEGEWDYRQQKVKGDSPNAQKTNAKLELVRYRVFCIAQEASLREVPLRANLLKLLYQGTPTMVKPKNGRKFKFAA